MSEDEFNEMIQDPIFRPQIVEAMKGLSQESLQLKNNYPDPEMAALHYASILKDRMYQNGVKNDSDEYEKIVSDLTQGFILLKHFLKNNDADFIEKQTDRDYLSLYVNKFISVFYLN